MRRRIFRNSSLNDHIIYNDKNGDNSGGKTLFAILDEDLRLNHTDFDMI